MRRTILFVMVMALPVLAHADLADGFRGIPFGDAVVIAEAPIEGCRADSEIGVRWRCDTTIGDVPVVVRYMEMEDVYVGVVVVVEGYSSALTLLGTLRNAYGSGERKHDWDHGDLAARNWSDGDVMATWDWNKYSNVGTLSYFSISAYTLMEKRRAARTASGVGDL